MQIISTIKSTDSIHRYKAGDEKLFLPISIDEIFGKPNDYVEYHVYDINERLLNSAYDFRNYKPSTLDKINTDGTLQTIELDPGQDLIDLNYNAGNFISEYNFFRKRLGSSPDVRYFLKEISSDRTEIRIATSNIDNITIETEVSNIINEITSTPYYRDYLLNFGSNNCVIAVNIALDKNPASFEILFKLYEPLPSEIVTTDELWVVEEIIQTPIFNVDLANYIAQLSNKFLQGPNFDINVDDKHNSSLNYNSYNSLFATSSFSSSYQQALNLLKTKEIEINVDYNDFTNFIHFSSVSERLENFKYKLSLIELYQSQSLVLTNVPTNSTFVGSNKLIVQGKIDDIVSAFDGYEYFLYFESGSNSWPKVNTDKPYINYATTASAAITWFDNQIQNANYYDQENIDNLEYTVPEFIRDDSQNGSYLLFLNMIGQHFDNIWIFIKSITDMNIADNKLDSGISKDLIKDVLNSLGVKLYNSSANINIFDYLIGSTGDTFKYVYNENTGSYSTNVVSSSNETIPKDDLNKEILKRIYHNLPYLLKSKGTVRGLRALINCFGIPDTILKINEFGSYNENEKFYDVNTNRFSYSTFLSSSDNSIIFPWEYLSTTLAKPKATEFRFKLAQGYNVPTQSLFNIGSTLKIQLFQTSGSEGYIGLTAGPSSSYFNYTFPYNNNDWWNILMNDDGAQLRLYVGNKIGNKLGYYDTISVSGSAFITLSDIAGLGNSGSIFFQELRYWREPLNQSVFKRHILNPESYEGNSVSSSYSQLAFRATLGNNLIENYVSSSHPNQNIPPFIIGQQIVTISGSSVVNEEQYNSNSFRGGLTRNTDKIRINSYQSITGSVLSPYSKLENVSSSLSPDLHFVEVSFSPTNEINNDIKNQMGAFNLDNYIGDPGYYFSGSYDRLNTLNTQYFQKLQNSYNYYDYIRLIKFFDNSLFKMIDDFTPARSNTISGVTIESPILERNKVKNVPPSFTSQDIADFNLRSSSIKDDNSYYYNKLQGNKKPFYTGEIAGTALNVYKYFTGSNANPYILPENNNGNSFRHSDFNILLNNVLNNTYSANKRKIELFAVSSSIEVKAELQDYYDDLYSFQYSRYFGSRVTSHFYNTFTTGDISYGKTAAIDKNVRQIGLFTEIVSSSFLPYRNNVSLKYLIDESGSLTELNQRNKNWEDVQRTFIAGDYLNVSLFDNQKYGNQKTLDGNKIIFNSGYSYYPILYFSGSDSRLYFAYTGINVNKLFRALNVNGGFISGSSTLLYPSIGGNIYNIFDQLDGTFADGNINYTIGSSGTQTFPTYSVPEAGNYKFTSQFGVNLAFTSSLQSGSYTFNINKNGTIINTQTLAFTSSISLTQRFTTNAYYSNTPDPVEASFDYQTAVPIDLYNTVGVFVTTIKAGHYLRIYTGSYAFGTNICAPGTLMGRDRQFLYATSSNGSTFNNLPGVTSGNVPVTCGNPSFNFTANYRAGVYEFSTQPFGPTFDYIVTQLSTLLSFNLATTFASYTVGDKVTFEFEQGPFSTTNFTSSVTQGELRNQLQINQAGNNPYVDNIPPFVSGSTNGDTVILSQGLTSLIDYLYLPSTGSNALYPYYGDVDYNFSPKLGDILIIRYGGGAEIQEFTVEEVTTVSGKLNMRLSPDLPSLLDIPTYDNSTVDLFLLLTKIDDETNIIIRFNKRQGRTSYGIVIPQNIHKDILNNIDIIMRQVKQKLLTDIGGVGIDIDGGSF